MGSGVVPLQKLFPFNRRFSQTSPAREKSSRLMEAARRSLLKFCDFRRGMIAKFNLRGKYT